MQYNTIGLIGGSGFIGAHVVNTLVKAGYRVRLATRRRENAHHLIMLPIEVLEVDVHDPAALTAFAADTDALINLAGILHSRRGAPYGIDFARVHVELPQKLIEACRANGIQRLLHLSALGADPNGPSMYLRSKGEGERAVREASDLQATIFRPSVVFGPGDHFLSTFARLQRIFPIIPLACAHVRFQPVYGGDVAHALVNAINLKATFGRNYELGGPRIYTLKELVRLAGDAIGKPCPIIALPDWAARLQARVFEFVSKTPLLSRDNLDSMRIDYVCSAPIAPELSVQPASVEAIIPEYLSRSG